jgi:hypothetical protein
LSLRLFEGFDSGREVQLGRNDLMVERRYHYGNSAGAATAAEGLLQDDLHILKEVLFRQEGKGWWLPSWRCSKSVDQSIDARVHQGMLDALQCLVEDMMPWDSARACLIGVRHEDPSFVCWFAHLRIAKEYDFLSLTNCIMCELVVSTLHEAYFFRSFSTLWKNL